MDNEQLMVMDMQEMLYVTRYSTHQIRALHGLKFLEPVQPIAFLAQPGTCMADWKFRYQDRWQVHP